MVNGSPVNAVARGRRESRRHRQEVGDDHVEDGLVLDDVGGTGQRVATHPRQDPEDADDRRLAVRPQLVQDVGKSVQHVHPEQTQNQIRLNDLDVLEFRGLFLEIFFLGKLGLRRIRCIKFLEPLRSLATTRHSYQILRVLHKLRISGSTLMSKSKTVELWNTNWRHVLYS